MFFNQNPAIKTTGADDIKDKVVQHRNRFYHILINRYMELLPSLITYQSDNSTVNINWLNVEIALRNNYRVAIGLTTNQTIDVLGVITSEPININNHHSLFKPRRLNQNDIDFTIPPEHRFDHYLELSSFDDYNTGNFVVLQNKPFQRVSDLEILNHYATELAEIVTSRFSLSMQSKITTFFIDELGGETVNQIVNDLYNGSPYVKVSKFFDPEEQIIHVDNPAIATNFIELKREYQNKLSELNNMLGINSLAVEKSSGVSDIEANGNQSFTGSNANIYLDTRNKALQGLNVKYNCDIEALYNDNVNSELSNVEDEDLLKADLDGSDNHEQNDNNIE